ncbi:MAG: hypothetical protein II921_00765 [Treponema sp.]|nr:hypothetical protein [Treponema sp.]
MRRTSLFLCVFLILLPVWAFSQMNDASALQSVFPSTVYIGDTVEIRYAFHTELNLLGSDARKNRLELSADYPVFLAQKDKFTVLDAYIENNGNEYLFLMNIVPWETGKISFPYFDLCSLISYSSGSGKAEACFYMELSPVEVFSVAEKNNVHVFLPPSPPLLIPGTAFLIVCLSILFLFLFGMLVFAVANIPAIKTKLSELLYLYSMKKVSRRTVKKLQKLRKMSEKMPKDSDFALNLQKIFREYLTKHFSENFSSLTSSEIDGKLDEIFDSDIPPYLEYSGEFFARTDFVRFASGSFLSGERERIVDNLVRIVGADL